MASPPTQTLDGRVDPGPNRVWTNPKLASDIDTGHTKLVSLSKQFPVPFRDLLEDVKRRMVRPRACFETGILRKIRGQSIPSIAGPQLIKEQVLQRSKYPRLPLMAIQLLE
jgi:hypothetical protein